MALSCQSFSHSLPPDSHILAIQRLPPSSTFSQQRVEALKTLELSSNPLEELKEETVKEAFRRKALACHPDRCGGRAGFRVGGE